MLQKLLKVPDLSFRELKTTYFKESDPQSLALDKTLKRVKERADKLGITSIVVASTRGETGLKASELFKGYNLVVVTHQYGFSEPNTIELTEENRRRIIANGAKLLTTTHALGGIGRAVRRKFDTMQIDELIANTLRIFGEGMKVAVEITLMAADSGLIRTDEDVISVGKWDTAVVVKPAYATNFFELMVKEIICKGETRWE
jgi:hypothetical protein